MEIRTVEANGSTYYVLVVPNSIGSSIGWKDWYIVDESELDALAAAAYTTGEVSQANLNILFSVSNEDAEDFIPKFAAHLRGEASRTSRFASKTISFSLFPVTSEGEEVVRFNVTGLKEYGTAASFSPSVFDHFYYEVPALDFQAFAARIMMP